MRSHRFCCSCNHVAEILHFKHSNTKSICLRYILRWKDLHFSIALSLVHVGSIIWPEYGIRWQLQEMYVIGIIDAFRRWFCIDRSTLNICVCSSTWRRGVNHSTYTSGCGKLPSSSGRLKIARTCATCRPAESLNMCKWRRVRTHRSLPTSPGPVSYPMASLTVPALYQTELAHTFSS